MANTILCSTLFHFSTPIRIHVQPVLQHISAVLSQCHGRHVVVHVLQTIGRENFRGWGGLGGSGGVGWHLGPRLGVGPMAVADQGGMNVRRGPRATHGPMRFGQMGANKTRDASTSTLN